MELCTNYNLIYFYHRELFYRRKYWLIVSTLVFMILYEFITKNIEVPETIDNRQEAYIKRRVQQEETKEVVVQMIKSEILSNSIYEQQSHWINQTTNNGANLYLYSAYYVSIILP